MTTTDVRQPMHPFWMVVAALFGVALPVVTLVIEALTHMCAAVFFDPIPTIWHIGLVALVPVANVWALWAMRRAPGRCARWLWWANGFTLGVAMYYSLLYVPLMPLAVVAIMMLGWGLLPLAPFFSLLIAWRLRFLLGRCWGAAAPAALGWWLAWAAGLVGAVLLAMPENLTRSLERMAVSDDPIVAARGVHWLRAVGDEATLLRDCYGANRRAGMSGYSFVPVFQPVAAEQARELYYRTTGRVFNSIPPPQRRYTARGWDFLDEFDWDDALGGEAIAGVVRGLRLRESRLDAVCSPNEAWAYVEWIMEFANTHANQREARVQIGLPPGAVVSRLTLWINGEEREAAFGGRAQTRQAYRDVAVGQRRDPVLVTTCGPDRVLMQCFPVPPNGAMKVRLGITVPLVLRKANEAVLVWPSFLERNFKLAAGPLHSVWLQSPTEPAVATPGLTSAPTSTGTVHVRGQLTDEALGSGAAAVVLRWEGSRNRFVAPDTAGKPGALILQTIESGAGRWPARVVTVVDGSTLMGPHANRIADTLTELAGKTDLRVLVAHDELGGAATETSATITQVRQLRYRGGHDNLPSLLWACELAASVTNGAVLWIHAPQPVLLSSVERLRQFLERADPGYRPRIFDWSVQPGPNRVAEKLDDLSAIQTLPVIGAACDRLCDWVESPWKVRRQQVVVSGVPDGTATASKHVVRLWAKEETDRLIAQRRTTDARALATAHQLVTAVTGAVVLETAQQYAQHNLHPADPNTVPIVPEPVTWLLLVMALALLIAPRTVTACRVWRAGRVCGRFGT